VAIRLIAASVLSLALAGTANGGESPEQFIGRLDAEIKRGESVLRSGEGRAIAQQSKRFVDLMNAGEQFGKSVFDQPYGYCFGAGVDAQAWWSTSVRSGAPAGSAASSMDQYRAHRQACLEAKVEAKKDPCLAVLDVNDKGEVVELPKPSGCK
jgi:hypothetical protein